MESQLERGLKGNTGRLASGCWGILRLFGDVLLCVERADKTLLEHPDQLNALHVSPPG